MAASRTGISILKRRTIVAGSFGAVLVGASLTVLVASVSRYIERTAEPYVYDKLDSLPRRDVGLVLGTSRNTAGGLNEFYTKRIEAAAELFHKGKIGHIIVSGSNQAATTTSRLS